MALKQVEKQPYEKFWTHAKFGAVMAEDETISSFTGTAVDSVNDDATATLIEPGSVQVGTGDDIHKVFLRIQGGVMTLSPYKFTVRIITSIGNKWEVDGKVKVKET